MAEEMSLREILQDLHCGIQCRECVFTPPCPKKEEVNQAFSAIQAHIDNRCEKCKEGKLNTIARYFKKYNKTLAHYKARRLSILELKDIANTSCWNCKHERENCYITCSIIATRIFKAQEEKNE